MYPWSLVRGDIEENLIKVSNSDRPSETMASQCWLLIQVGLNLRQFVETVQLLQDCNWTSTIAMQQHTILAVLKRAHTEYSEDMLWLVRRTGPIEPKVARCISLRWRAAREANAGATHVCR